MFCRRFSALAALAVSTALIPLAVPESAEAARVSPMVAEIVPSGTGSIVRIEVTNDEDRQIPFELIMHRGTISETGEVSLEPADDRFVVFPPQIAIGPRSQQVFRIQFLPDPDLATSEIYYASISQLPVALDPADSRIQMLMRFNVLINVVPPGTRSDPAVDWIRAAERERPVPEGQASAETAEIAPQTGIEVRISNRGNRYFGAGETSWTISGTDPNGESFTETLTDKQVRETTGLGIVAPDQARIFFIPMDRQLNADSLKISFE